MNNLLSAHGLHKSFYSDGEKLHVIRGINISAEKGEVLFIIGPSGAGKSTLLHILAGLDKPGKGKVTLDGTDIYGLTDKKRAAIRNKEIGFVFQFYHLLSEFSAIENVMLPGLMRRGCNVNKLKQKAGRILSQVGMSKRIKHLPGELSGGEQQRVAIARALINSPRILFCDEPAGNLDSKNGTAIYELIFGINKEEGMTVVVVTHQINFSDKGNRRLGIKDGLLSDSMIQ
ncbi:MAG: ABC transporter ATP-binding protein [Candidatus Omnitrophota bacterium]|nr:ABC transporter ATP-binding protein [Candidatus Omnitrophota bacterium]